MIEWRWVSFIWGYALKRRNPVELKYLIDIMQSRKLKRQVSEDEYHQEAKIKHYNPLDPVVQVREITYTTEPLGLIRQQVCSILRQHFRSTVRFDSTNPFDFYDRFNLEINDE